MATDAVQSAFFEMFYVASWEVNIYSNAYECRVN